MSSVSRRGSKGGAVGSPPSSNAAPQPSKRADSAVPARASPVLATAAASGVARNSGPATSSSASSSSSGDASAAASRSPSVSLTALNEKSVTGSGAGKVASSRGRVNSWDQPAGEDNTHVYYMPAASLILRASASAARVIRSVDSEFVLERVVHYSGARRPVELFSPLLDELFTVFLLVCASHLADFALYATGHLCPLSLSIITTAQEHFPALTKPLSSVLYCDMENNAMAFMYDVYARDILLPKWAHYPARNGPNTTTTSYDTILSGVAYAAFFVWGAGVTIAVPCALFALLKAAMVAIEEFVIPRNKVTSAVEAAVARVNDLTEAVTSVVAYPQLITIPRTRRAPGFKAALGYYGRVWHDAFSHFRCRLIAALTNIISVCLVLRTALYLCPLNPDARRSITSFLRSLGVQTGHHYAMMRHKALGKPLPLDATEAEALAAAALLETPGLATPSPAPTAVDAASAYTPGCVTTVVLCALALMALHALRASQYPVALRDASRRA